MKVLIIGGTRFVGLAMTREAILRGYDVTVFHRSDRVPVGTESATHVQGDRLTDLAQLADTQWDAVIDVCAYRPGEVEIVADALGPVTKKFVFVSTVSVYDDSIAPRSDETAQLLSTVEVSALGPETVPIMEHYGALKVLCEEVAQQRFADVLIIRPTYVIGPDDYTNRFTAWVERIAKGGIVDAPEPQSAAMQYIDVRDLATFTLNSLEKGLTGPFHVATPSGGLAFGDMLRTILDTISGPESSLHWISVEEAKASQEAFPLWAEGEDASMLRMDTSRAIEAGLEVRDLAATVADVAASLN